MDEGKVFQTKLDQIATEMRALELLYERYFSGEEKRAPLKERNALEKKLRRLTTRRIIRTDHRFRFESLSSRYHTYATRWDRVQRLMDEGRYVRHLDRRRSNISSSSRQRDNYDTLYDSLILAHRECSMASPPPGRSQFNSFLERQKAQIQERFGKREVEFRIVIENGKPKLRAKAKK
ncbi:MAG: hypothetical protein PWP34_1396 [Desulfuromonadales bacterium]|jgi:hypothetical protein|nr:hypothetical protein [Desulfuromonadales bacterium]